MALATQCPHCQTRFRVASDQLKLRGGIVRCGACQRIFDGSAHLIDLDAPAAAGDTAQAVAEAAAPVVAPPSPSAPALSLSPSPETATEPVDASVDEPVPAPAPEPAPDAQENTDAVDFGAQPVDTADVERSFEPLALLPGAQANVEADVEPAAAQPQDPEPPQGDVLAQAVQAIAEAQADVPAPDADAPAPQPRDPEPPHGDVLAPAVHAIVDEDPAHSIRPAGIEPLPQPQDPEPPHGELLSSSLDKAAHAPQQRSERMEPRLEPVSFAAPARIEPSFDVPVDEELVAQPVRDHEPGIDAEPAGAAPAVPPLADDAPPLPLRASAGADARDTASQAPFAAASAIPAPRSARAKATEARARRTRLVPTRIEAPKLRVPETDEPEFVKRSRKQEQTGRIRRILMGAGAAVLLLVLASQVVLNFRNVLAARYPGARPALEGACALLGCRVELPTQIDNLAIENGELTTLGPDTYALNTLLRNQGSLVQSWPSIELELTDANDKPVLRRVFSPAEYLPQHMVNGAATGAAGFAARSEQAIKLHFALDDLKPSGYHIFIFYP
jgi:predicted Zn finger-like uncharacterized protein